MVRAVRSAKSPLRMASLPAATPSVELVQSVPTDVYRVPSPAPPSAPQRHVVLVPGNPGQPGFYARAAAEQRLAVRLVLRKGSSTTHAYQERDCQNRERLLFYSVHTLAP